MDDCVRLEIECVARHRGFESLSLRQMILKRFTGSFRVERFWFKIFLKILIKNSPKNFNIIFGGENGINFERLRLIFLKYPFLKTCL